MGAGDALCAVHPDVKAIGACNRCGTFGCGTCLTQRGNDWLCSACLNRVQALPWDEREQLGLWRAWWRTSVQMISNPGQTLATAPPDASFGSSMLYAFLSSIVGFGPTFGLYLLVLGPILLIAGESAEKPMALAGGAMIYGIMVGYLFALLFMQSVGTLFSAGLDHLALMLLGANPKSFTVSLRASALSTGPYLVGLVPACSFYVFPLWSLVLRIFALKAFHQTTGGKATAAVLIPIVVLCGGVFMLYAAIIALAAAAGR